MRFSIWPSPTRPVDEALDRARFADQNGWFGYWYADHYMPDTGDESFRSGDTHEVWGVLPAVAAITDQVRIGPLVSPTSVHHPAVLANRAMTIDHLSGGRMVLGLGAGWQINEHAAYGIELQAPKPRVDRFEEAIQIVRSMLDDERTTFAGEYYTITDAPSDPMPVQDTLPILVGTSGPRMCRITATHAQEWNSWGSPSTVEAKLATFTAACDKVGVDPATKHTSVQPLFFLTDDADRVAQIESGDAAANAVAGSNEKIIDAIGQYRDLGFDEVIVPDFHLNRERSARDDFYQRFNDEIVSAFG